MQYVFVRWLHDDASDPILLYSELGDDRFETRKVEIFIDGRIGLADDDFEHGGTSLGDQPIPELEEIAADPEDFQPQEIRRVEFEAIWCLACRSAGYAP